MNVHEYQAKEILKKHGIPVPPFVVVSSADEVPEALKTLGVDKAVVKVQVHAGGRGKAGGVKLADNPDEVKAFTKELLGLKIVNRQTGKEGVVARQVMISVLADIEKEYYLGAVIDREQGKAVLIASPEGGVEIEEVAGKNPEKILQVPIALDGSVEPEKLKKLVSFMEWEGQAAEEGEKIAASVAKAFKETDASTLEINPLVLTPDNHLTALDAKLSVDDNALFRQPEIQAFYDPTQISSNEVAADKAGLAYIALDGDIGCMVNGAGLAMATMDLIQHHGGRPANFLDVGGGASKEKVAHGFKIILSDPNVKAILVNIFGGIMNCATIAEGIKVAVNEQGIHVPLVVRMEGTNVEQGRKILAESGLNIIVAEDLKSAAYKVTAAK